MLQRVVDAAAQMLHQRLGQLLVVVEGDHFVQNRHVAGLLHVGRHAEDQPQRVVVEAGADVVVAALGQRLVLVVGAAVRELGGGDVQDALAGAGGDQVHEAQQVLRGIAEAHAAADAALIVAGGARHVEGHHALVLVPQARHAVHANVAAVHLERGQELRPVVAQRGEGGVELRVGFERIQQRVGRGLVDDVGRDELLVLGVLAVAQHEDERDRLAGLDIAPDAVAGDGRKAAGDAVVALVGGGHVRLAEAVVVAQEGRAVGVEAVDLGVHRVHGEVVAALAVLGLVVDGAALDLDLAGGEVALEVGGVVLGVPQAELHEAVKRHVLGGGGFVGQLHAGHQRVHAAGHEGELLGLQAVLDAGDAGVAQAVAALIAVQLRLDGHPAGRPEAARVVDVEVLSAGVGGHVVVAIAGDAQHAGVLVEAVAAAGVAHQGEERLAAQVVDPGRGGVGAGDDVLPRQVIKMAVLHGFASSFFGETKTF